MISKKLIWYQQWCRSSASPLLLVFTCIIVVLSLVTMPLQQYSFAGVTKYNNYNNLFAPLSVANSQPTIIQFGQNITFQSYFQASYTIGPDGKYKVGYVPANGAEILFTMYRPTVNAKVTGVDAYIMKAELMPGEYYLSNSNYNDKAKTVTKGPKYYLILNPHGKQNSAERTQAIKYASQLASYIYMSPIGSDATIILAEKLNQKSAIWRQLVIDKVVAIERGHGESKFESTLEQFSETDFARGAPLIQPFAAIQAKPALENKIRDRVLKSIPTHRSLSKKFRTIFVDWLKNNPTKTIQSQANYRALITGATFASTAYVADMLIQNWGPIIGSLTAMAFAMHVSRIYHSSPKYPEYMDKYYGKFPFWHEIFFFGTELLFLGVTVNILTASGVPWFSVTPEHLANFNQVQDLVLNWTSNWSWMAETLNIKPAVLADHLRKYSLEYQFAIISSCVTAKVCAIQLFTQGNFDIGASVHMVKRGLQIEELNQLLAEKKKLSSEFEAKRAALEDSFFSIAGPTSTVEYRDSLWIDVRLLLSRISVLNDSIDNISDPELKKVIRSNHRYKEFVDPTLWDDKDFVSFVAYTVRLIASIEANSLSQLYLFGSPDNGLTEIAEKAMILTVGLGLIYRTYMHEKYGQHKLPYIVAKYVARSLVEQSLYATKSIVGPSLEAMTGKSFTSQEINQCVEALTLPYFGMEKDAIVTRRPIKNID